MVTTRKKVYACNISVFDLMFITCLFLFGSNVIWAGSASDLVKRGIDEQNRGNLTSGYEYFQQAASLANAQGEDELGFCYLIMGMGTTKNEKKAVMWFQKAADQGNAESEYWLGDLLRKRERRIERSI